MDNLLALPNGTVLAGDYRVRRVLGAGGFGITYFAEELSLSRGVAIKEYFPSDFAARESTLMVRSKSTTHEEDYRWGLDRFIEEAKTLAKFEHPNIARVYRYFRQNNTGYMVLQFEEGRSFKSWFDALGRPPTQAELEQIVSPLLDALELIHGQDFLHRDIAPDNIIIRADGSPVLIDFGSARGEVAQHSRTVSALVKPGYSPFEQYAVTGKQQGPWTDIYALGATLYHAVTGARPVDSPTRMTADDLKSAVTAAKGTYRPEFLKAIDRALALRIEGRPQSIAEWRRELMARPAGGAAAPVARAATGTDGVTARTRKIATEAPLVLRWPGRRKPAEAADGAATPARPKGAAGGAAVTPLRPVVPKALAKGHGAGAGGAAIAETAASPKQVAAAGPAGKRRRSLLSLL
ncbi:MAG: serine/threonine-protein kinase, partial [Hyphomicrobiaceae bacterium]